MSTDDQLLAWTEEQWTRIRQVVAEEAARSRVASSFLPLVGPLPGDTNYVPRDRLDLEPLLHAFPRKGPDDQAEEQKTLLRVDDIDSMPLATLQVRVAMRGAQVSDPELSSGLQMFRRAANVLARLEDSIVFNGQKKQSEGPRYGTPVKPHIWDVLGGEKKRGLALPVDKLKKHDLPFKTLKQRSPEELGNELVKKISAAIGRLEADGHFGPFACVLDQKFFEAVQTPKRGSLVLPQDRIIPFLGGGPLLRSSVLANRSGIVVALGGAPIDLVVATDMSVQFLQVTVDPRFVFRVHEKLTLRVKQPEAICALVQKS